jgi:citronellol/citronellal dehydrogenase
MTHAKRFQSVFRDDLFAGQTALVTGGGTGIGRCIAHELARLGATVIVAGRRTEPLAAVVAEIRDAGGVAHAESMNIRDEDAVQAAVKSLVERHGHIGLLVNNAGGQFALPAVLIKPKGWKAVIETNLNGTWFVTQALFAQTMRKHGGAVVSIVADMWNGFPGMAHTGAARAGVVNLMQTLAIEWAAAGVRLNCVAPGFVLSSGLHNYPDPVRKMAREVFVSGPAGRPATESEVSAATCFLLSPAAAYISGTTVRVDGGSSLHKDLMLPISGQHDKIKPFHGFHLEADLPEIFADLAPRADSE